MTDLAPLILVRRPHLPTVSGRLAGGAHQCLAVAALSDLVNPGERGSAACAELGAQQAMTAAIHRARGNWLVMTACLRDPGLAENEAAVWAMLRSVRLY